MSTDIHTQTAAKMFGVPEEQVTKEQRDAAKVANFWPLYGNSHMSLADAMKQARQEAINANYRAFYGGEADYADVERRLLSMAEAHPRVGNRAGMTVDAGRMSSWSPRPHNIPIRTEEGRRVRGLFNPYWGVSRYVGPMERAEIREHARPLAVSFILRGLV